jgi:MFS family permease
MVIGTAMVAATAVGAAFSPSPVILGFLTLLMGGGWAFWQLARLAYVSEQAPVEIRGRALSMLGGMNRVGNFIGPVIGGFLGHQFGLESAFIAQAVMGIAASAMMFLIVREGSGSEDMAGHGVAGRVVSVVQDNRRTFYTAGPVVIALGLLRQARQVFLPLWGNEIGLDVAQIGLLTSLSFFMDATVFYPAGTIMDKWGRKWTAGPCLTTLAIGFILLPLTNDFYSFLAVAILSGLGNGMGAGINMTLGADFAPDIGRGEFLGVWRLVSDLGMAGGPMVISALTGVASLAVASVASGGIGLVGAAILVAFVPETLKRRPAVTEHAGQPG